MPEEYLCMNYGTVSGGLTFERVTLFTEAKRTASCS